MCFFSLKFHTPSNPICASLSCLLSVPQIPCGFSDGAELDYRAPLIAMIF